MDINIFYDKDSWINGMPSEILEGEVQFRNYLVMIDTFEDYKRYRQILSSQQIFAITYKMPYGFAYMEKELFLYLDAEAWSKSMPNFEFKGVVCEDEINNEYISFITNDGYKQFISRSKIFSLVYER